MFTFDVFWGGLGTGIFENSSLAANNTRSRLTSRLSFLFLWLCIYVQNTLLKILENWCATMNRFKTVASLKSDSKSRLSQIFTEHLRFINSKKNKNSSASWKLKQQRYKFYNPLFNWRSSWLNMRSVVVIYVFHWNLKEIIQCIVTCKNSNLQNYFWFCSLLAEIYIYNFNVCSCYPQKLINLGVYNSLIFTVLHFPHDILTMFLWKLDKTFSFLFCYFVFLVYLVLSCFMICASSDFLIMNGSMNFMQIIIYRWSV